METQFNILAVVQNGRLSYEALLFMASLRAAGLDNMPVYLAEPQPGPLWQDDPRISNPDIRAELEKMGAVIVPFDNKVFGQSYAYGNKIEALKVLPKGQPFVFFDTDTIFTGPLCDVPFDFTRPSASLRCTGTWPEPELYGPGYSEIWQSLYERFDLDFNSTLDLDQPDEYWQRYLYFNAGYFFGACPQEFGALYQKFAVEIRDNPPGALDGQSLDPWLDQIALPLVIHALGGGRDSLPAGFLDGKTSCHYRALPLLYARESDAVIATLEAVCAPNRIKKLLKEYEPFKRLVFQGRGHKLRAVITPADLLKPEEKLRKKIKNRGFWMR
ncbi:MAG: hypothetical protein V3V13_03935 [Paracoccaceae bacterium]